MIGRKRSASFINVCLGYRPGRLFYIYIEWSAVPHTLIIMSGSNKNLVPGLFEYLTVAMGAKAKYILIFLASSGIVENAINPTREETCQYGYWI